MSATYDVNVTYEVTIKIHNPDVEERVTGAGGDEWRSQFYDLFTAQDVAEHLAYNATCNGVTDVSRLEGWGDCSPHDVEFIIESSETWTFDAATASRGQSSHEGEGE